MAIEDVHTVLLDKDGMLANVTNAEIALASAIEEVRKAADDLAYYSYVHGVAIERDLWRRRAANG